MYFKKIFNDVLFQGRNKKNKYFEGWYYKFVNSEENVIISFIPGICINRHDPHAFIQIIFVDAVSKKISSEYIRFREEDFAYSDKPFRIRIRDNYFFEDSMEINIEEEKVSVKGIIQISNLTKLKKNVLSPNIMGPFAYLRFLECYHGVVSMDHSLSGELTINDRIISFNSGKGYIEKDYGKSFPKNYIWLQCNNFKNTNTSLMFSWAHIPFLSFSFKGYLCSLFVDGKEYRFATYNSSKIKLLEVKDNTVKLVLKKRKIILEIEARIEDNISLLAPKNGIMQDIIKEGISGEIKIKITDRSKNLIYEDFGKCAGIEIVNV